MNAYLALLIVTVSIGMSNAADTCSYNFCENEVKERCTSVGDKDYDIANCVNSNRMYLTWRPGRFSFSKHSCCAWTITDVHNKYLRCVEKIRMKSGTCYEGSKSNYVYKVKTAGGCHKFSCF